MMPILLFILFILCEPIKRIFSFFLYPLVYPFRDELRHDTLHLCLWNDYLYFPKFKWLWFFLDDSIKMESGHEYSTEPNRINSYWFKSEFGKSYHWSAIRNSFVNWNNWVAFKLGKFDKVLNSWGEISFQKLKKKRKGYRLELRQYAGGNRLYLEVYLFNRWNQVGTLSGQAPRFEIDIMKDR